jgi:transcriptional regulator with XRE-family HTH domain
MVPIVPVQCWIARTALGWTVRDLAHAAEVSLSTVRRFERGGAVRVSTAETIQRTIERPASSVPSLGWWELRVA